MCCSSPQTPSFLSFPSDSCLIFPLRMTNVPPPVNCVLASITLVGLSAGNVTADDPASTHFTQRRDGWRSQSLSLLYVLKQGRGRRWDSTWSSPARRRCRGRVPVAMDRVLMKRSKMRHTPLSYTIFPSAKILYLPYCIKTHSYEDCWHLKCNYISFPDGFTHHLTFLVCFMTSGSFYGIYTYTNTQTCLVCVI